MRVDGTISLVMRDQYLITLRSFYIDIGLVGVSARLGVAAVCSATTLAAAF